jgi:hypothetical protein
MTVNSPTTASCSIVCDSIDFGEGLMSKNIVAFGCHTFHFIFHKSLFISSIGFCKSSMHPERDKIGLGKSGVWIYCADAEKRSEATDIQRYGEKWTETENTFVSVEVDFDAGTIRYFFGDKSLGVAFSDIKPGMKLSLFISLCQVYDSASIIDNIDF